MIKVNNSSIREIIKERLYKIKNEEVRILNLEDLDTSEVTNMDSLFEDIIVDEIVGIDKWDISNVQSIAAMFKHCRNSRYRRFLILGDLSNWNTSNLVNCWMLFEGCSAIYVGNLSKWNMNKVTNSWGALSYNLGKIFIMKNNKIEILSDEVYKNYENNYIEEIKSLKTKKDNCNCEESDLDTVCRYIVSLLPKTAYENLEGVTVTEKIVSYVKNKI